MGIEVKDAVMLTDDEDDLIGDLTRPPEPAYGYDSLGRPMHKKRGARPGPKPPEPDPIINTITVDRLAEVLQGVSIPFLMQVFKMSRGTVQERLQPLNPIKHGKNSSPYYDLREASAYLIEPKTELAAYLKAMSPADLPEHLRDAVWSARLKQQRWEENAGELWRTSAVQEVLGDLFRTIKERTQSCIDTIDEKEELSAKQRDTFKKVLHGMMTDIKKDLEKNLNTRHSGSQLTGSDDA